MDDRSPFARRNARTFPVMWIAVVTLVVVGLDLWVKRLVTAGLGPDVAQHAWWLVGDDVGLQYVRNTGAAFGVLPGNPELLAAVSVVIALGLVWLITVEIANPWWSAVAAGLLLGGTLGNLVGRLGDGFVTDYIAIGPWPRFNVADSAITIGMAIFVVGVLVPSGGDGDAAGALESDRMRADH